MFYIKGRIVTAEDVFPGFVQIEDERIVKVDAKPANRCKVFDFGDSLVLPGFIDTHLHGFCEHTIFDVNSIKSIALEQVRFGTTGFVPAVASLSEERYLEFGRNVLEAQKLSNGRSARILGAEFEGPFINPLRKGGMDADFLRAMDTCQCRRYLDEAGEVLKVMTLSPELAGSEDVIRLLRSRGVVVSLGHSTASEEQIVRAIECGANNVCHMFNTFCRPADIEAGLIAKESVERLLCNRAVMFEFICDMHHVEPGWIKFAAELSGPGRFVAVTDGMAGAGLLGGEYVTADGRKSTTQDGAARLLSDGTLIGSSIAMNNALRNLVEICRIDLISAVKFTSANPARLLGLENELGSIEADKIADIAVLDAEYNCVATFVHGEMVYGD